MYPVGGPADTSLQPRDLHRFARQSSSSERLRAFLPPERKLERCFGRSSLLSVDSGLERDAYLPGRPLSLPHRPVDESVHKRGSTQQQRLDQQRLKRQNWISA